MYKTIRQFLAILSVIALQSSLAGAGPLRDAAMAGDTETLRELLAEGADPDEAGQATPLYFACQRGHLAAVEVLIAHGADVNRLAPWGGPLHAASRSGNTAIVELLIGSGADPNLLGGENNRTPLHDAARAGAAEVVRLLVRHGADPNARATGRDKGPVIHFAASRGHDEVVRLLRELGARPRQVEPITRAELEAADPALGRSEGAACTPCHTYTPGDPGERGPSLWNIVGRPVASEPDFPYTRPMQAMGGVWDYEALNRFLADVPGSVPGTAMYTGSVPDRTRRIAVIAYLRSMADAPAPLP